MPPSHSNPADPNDQPEAPRIVVDIATTQGLLEIDRDEVTRLVTSVLLGEKIDSAQISLAIVDDATIQRINRQHLAHDWPTDVITFELSDPDDPELVAEIVVSAEMALTTAREIDARPDQELALYIVHGLLHLCGYDDTSETEVSRMRQREDEVLRRLGLPNTFAMVENRWAHRDVREQPPCSV